MVAPTYRAGERHTLEHYHYEGGPWLGLGAAGWMEAQSLGIIELLGKERYPRTLVMFVSGCRLLLLGSCRAVLLPDILFL